MSNINEVSGSTRAWHDFPTESGVALTADVYVVYFF